MFAQHPKVRFLAALVVASLAACSNKSTPNEDNLAAAIHAKLAAAPQKCLPSISWPVQEEPTHAGNPYAFYDAARGFVDAGLATERQERPSAATNFRKKSVFSLTDEGRATLINDEYQPFPTQKTGRFCYGEVRLKKIEKWDAPVTVGGRTDTVVQYSYELTEIPEWAKTAALLAAYEQLAADIAGRGHARLPVTLVNGEWRPGS